MSVPVSCKVLLVAGGVRDKYCSQEGVFWLVIEKLPFEKGCASGDVSRLQKASGAGLEAKRWV